MRDHINTDLRFSIIPEWVLDAEISDRAIRLYSILARYADNDTLQAFPSRETLARRAHCHIKSVDRAIQELIDIGAVLKAHRRSGESYQSNLYTLKRVATAVSPGRDKAVQGVGTPQSPGRDTSVHLTRTTELEPNNLTSSFNEFWELYPRKMGKGEARGSFQKAVNRHGLDVVMDGVRRLASDPNLPAPQFVPRASTWLNQERWDDDPYPKQDPLAIPGVSRGVRPAAEGPVRRLWVRKLHDEGEHYECKPGEFGCK